MDTQPISPQSHIWQLGLGFSYTAVLYALVKTGVIEQLRQQSRSLPQLAQACELDPDVLYRVLRFAALIGIVEQAESQYTLTETGRLLLKDVPGSMVSAILLWGREEWQRTWQNLAYSLTTGGVASGVVAFDRAMGVPMFDYIEQNPEFGAAFHQWMTGSSIQVAQAITTAYDFTPYRSVCDIGGGQGLLLKSIVLANPHLRGILYDQEHVLRDHVLTDLDGRVQIQAGNFFERVPAAGLLLMKRILHDWNDEQCQVILGNCRQVMQPEARLLIIEKVLTPPLDITDAYYDLHMQLVQGGKERTEAEFGSLLQDAGLQLRRVIPTDSNMKIVEASL